MWGAARRGRDQTVIALLLVAFLAAVSGAGPASAADDTGAALPETSGSAASLDSVPPFFTAPAFQPAIQAAKERLKRQEERRASLEAAEDRTASETAYENLAASDALEVAERAYGEVLLEPAWDPFAVQPGAQLERYVGDFAARVDAPGETADSLVESTLPLRVPTDSGQKAPVDQELIAEGDALEPANPVTELSIPDQVSDAIELSDAGVTVQPLGVEAASAHLAGDTSVFYANALTDTDIVVRALPTGVATDYVLRSERSPERFSLRLSLPVGASLEQRGPEGLAIVRDGEALGLIAPPAAWDADGWDIPVSWDIDGSTLTVSVDHKGRDLHYPLYLDPTVTVFENQTGWPDFIGWQEVENPSTDRFYGFAGNQFWGNGLYTVGQQLDANGYPYYYPAWSLASWEFASPGPEAYIYAAQYNTVNIIRGEQYQRPYNPISAVNEGIWSYERNDWDGGVEYDAWGQIYGYSPVVITDQYVAGRTTTHCIEVGCPPVRANGQPAGTPGNHVILMTWVVNTGIAANNFYTYLGGAGVWLSDLTAPQHRFKSYTVNGTTTTTPPSNWMDTATLSVVTEASDRGLGVKTYKLNVPGLAQKVRTVSCSGDRLDRCPNTGAFWPSNSNDPDDPVTGNAFQWSTSAMPEGDNSVTARATDFSTNASPLNTWQVKVDRSAPTVALSGSLKQAADAGQTLDKDSYDLTISATDGSTSAPSQKRSGVKSIEVLVDGEPTDHYVEQPCAQGSCGMSDTWTLYTDDYEDGQHTVTVVVKDQLGHQTQRDLTVTTSHGTFANDETEPTVTLAAGPPAADGSYQLTMTATDAGSGVEHMELYVDAQLVQPYEQQCTNGGCPMVRTRTMSGSQSLASHEVFVSADDRVGNIGHAFSGKRKKYPFFGYNDDFPRREPQPGITEMLNFAVNGRANIIRFPIDWCALADVGGTTPTATNTNPANWNWSIYDPFFAQIAGNAAYNNLKVIPVLADSPPWANAAHRPCGQVVTPPDDAEPYRGYWKAFVEALLAHWQDNPQYDIRGDIAAIEVWNEPNHPLFWGRPDLAGDAGSFTPQPARFARLVNKAYEAIGESFTILPGGTSPFGDARQASAEKFLRSVHEDASTTIMAGAVDGVSIHLYDNKAESDGSARRTLKSRYEDVDAALTYAGRNDRPIWITEVGFAVPGSTLDMTTASERKQRIRLVDAYALFRDPGRKARSFIVHRLFDQPGTAQQPIEPNRFGVIPFDDPDQPPYTPRQAYCRLAELAGSPTPPPFPPC